MLLKLKAFFIFTKNYYYKRQLSIFTPKGDRIVFNILGLEAETEVINTRFVNWTEIIPNFFFILQNKAINDAPKHC